MRKSLVMKLVKVIEQIEMLETNGQIMSNLKMIKDTLTYELNRNALRNKHLVNVRAINKDISLNASH